MKFLIIRFSSIGDIVLTSPVIRCLKKQLPESEIHFLTKVQFKEIVAHNPYIDKVQLLAHSWELMLEELKLEQYDYLIDLHHNLRTLRVKRALRVKSFSFPKLNFQKYLLTAFKINILPKLSIVDRYMKTIQSFGVQNDGRGLDYFIAKKEETTQQDIPAAHLAGYIACVIGAALGTKRWPLHKWKSFCAEIDHPLILIGGKEDFKVAQAIAAIDNVKIFNACGKFSINESADLIRKSKFVITNDTGMMHIAAAYQKEIISLWGNTIPAFGMQPYYGKKTVNSIILETKKLWCRPCSKIGYKKCPLGHFKCMEKIAVPTLLQEARRRM